MPTIIDIDSGVPGYEVEEVSAAKDLAYGHFYAFGDRWDPEPLTAAGDPIDALIETGWRPTED